MTAAAATAAAFLLAVAVAVTVAAAAFAFTVVMVVAFATAAAFTFSVVVMVAFPAAAAFAFAVVVVVAFAAAAAFAFAVMVVFVAAATALLFTVVVMVAFAAAAALAFTVMVVAVAAATAFAFAVVVMVAFAAAAAFAFTVMVVFVTAATAAALFLTVVVMMAVTTAAALAFTVVMMVVAAAAALAFTVVMMVVAAAAAFAFAVMVMMVVPAAAATAAARVGLAEDDRVEGFFGFGHFKADHAEHLGDVRERKNHEAVFGGRHAHAAVDEGAGGFAQKVDVARHAQHRFDGGTHRPEFTLLVDEALAHFEGTALFDRDRHGPFGRFDRFGPDFTLGARHHEIVGALEDRLSRRGFRRKKLGEFRHFLFPVRCRRLRVSGSGPRAQRPGRVSSLAPRGPGVGWSAYCRRSAVRRHPPKDEGFRSDGPTIGGSGQDLGTPPVWV